MPEPDRHDTGAPFSKEEVALIRKAVVTPGARVECPRCGALLTPEAVAGEGTGAAGWWLHCDTCRRNLVVRNLRAPTIENE